MLRILWKQSPHLSAIISALVLVLVGLRFPDDNHTQLESWPEQARKKEARAQLAFLAALLLVRVAYIFRYHIDSDEPQHLHVVWGWTQGLLQYRDVFDNHMPLFHLLYAPLLSALGARADILFLMRLAMLPLYGVALWATYRLGCVLFSPRVGRWAAVFTGLFPGFFFCALEFRTDNLWTALWLLALALLVHKRMTLQRSFLGGVFLGAALSVSMKTTLLLGALSGASLVAVYTFLTPGARFPFHQVSRYALATASGVILIPLLLLAFFVTQGGWTPFWYGTIQHNVLPGLGHWHRPYPMFTFPVLLFLLWQGARVIARSTADQQIGKRRILIFLSTAGYASALFCFWPLWTREDYLPLYPPLVLLVTPLVLRGTDRFAEHAAHVQSDFSLSMLSRPLVVGSIEIILLLLGGPIWRDKTEAQTELLTDVLRLTKPEDSVVDLKGETVFRPRASYYVLEGITRTRIKYGLLTDDIPERLIAARTCVAVGDDDRFPAVTRAFLQDNYLSVGSLRVAGHWLDTPTPGNESASLTITIPARYVIVAEHGTVTGWLDGTPYDGARTLTPGRHEFRSTAESGRLAVIWAQAAERGFSPFGAPVDTSLQLTKRPPKVYD